MTTNSAFTNKETVRVDSSTDISENQHVNLGLKKRSRNVSNVFFSKISPYGMRKDGNDDTKLKTSKLRSSLVAITSGEELDVTTLDLSQGLSHDLLTKPSNHQTGNKDASVMTSCSSIQNLSVARRDSKSIIFISAYTLVPSTTNTFLLPTGTGTPPTMVSFGTNPKPSLQRPPTPAPPSRLFDTMTVSTLEGKPWVVSKLDECFDSSTSSKNDDDYFMRYLSETSPSP